MARVGGIGKPGALEKPRIAGGELECTGRGLIGKGLLFPLVMSEVTERHWCERVFKNF